MIYIHALQKSVGDAQAQGLRSLEVDDQLVFGGCSTGISFGCFTLKDSLHKLRAVPNSGGAIGPE